MRCTVCDGARSCFDIWHIGAYVKNQGNTKCCRTKERLRSVDAQFATSFLSLRYQKCTNSRGGLSFGAAKALRAEQAVRQGG